MNTAVLHTSEPRYAKLAKPKEKVDANTNLNPFAVKRSALSYRITDNLNKLAQPRLKSEQNLFNGSTPTVQSAPENAGSTGKQVRHKLINSNEQSKYAQESKKKKFLLDTYARITAARNKRCSKRLLDLSKPRNYVPQTDIYEKFDYFEPIKKTNRNPQHQNIRT